jgi:hypothetical protein
VTAAQTERRVKDESRYRLKRYVDSSEIPLVVFEAEVAGVGEIFRALKRGLGLSRPANGTAAGSR